MRIEWRAGCSFGRRDRRVYPAARRRLARAEGIRGGSEAPAVAAIVAQIFVARQAGGRLALESGDFFAIGALRFGRTAKAPAASLQAGRGAQRRGRGLPPFQIAEERDPAEFP
jgi:hypothetical protein